MDKSEFRMFCIEKLKKISQKNKTRADRNIAHSIQRLLLKLKPKSVLAYIDMPHEPNIRKLFPFIRAHSELFVPFMAGESFKMVKYRLPLRSAKFGIYEAANSHRKMNRVDVMIVPVVGVDKDFKRIGFGKGMYDRFHAKLTNKPIIIFVQTRACVTKKSITDIYDIKADYFVTSEKCVLASRLGNVNRSTIRRRCSNR